MSTNINLQNTDVFVNAIATTGNVDAGLYVGDGSQLTNMPTPPPTIYSALVALSSDSTVNGSTVSFVKKNVFPSTTGGMTINNGGFTCSTSGIVVPISGEYIVGVSAFYTTNVQRANVLVALTVNGTETPEHGANAYIRAQNGHNEATAHVTTLLDLIAGDEIGVAFKAEGPTGTVTLNGASNISHVFLYRVK